MDNLPSSSRKAKRSFSSSGVSSTDDDNDLEHSEEYMAVKRQKDLEGGYFDVIESRISRFLRYFSVAVNSNDPMGGDGGLVPTEDSTASTSLVPPESLSVPDPTTSTFLVPPNGPSVSDLKSPTSLASPKALSVQVSHSAPSAPSITNSPEIDKSCDPPPSTQALPVSDSGAERRDIAQRKGIVAIVRYDYEAINSDEISLVESQFVEILETLDENWSYGVSPDDEIGLFPSKCFIPISLERPASTD
ncbi:hypothetical protein GGU11DRAFT_751734 [Lentinula aff. detonsa]|nr:hypothetical protein GGU11DRAFT_751734 [Lentinula aff. detonsa]